MLSGTAYDGVFTAVSSPSNAPWEIDESTLHHWAVLNRLVATFMGGAIQNNLNSSMSLIAGAQTTYNSLRSIMPFDVYTGAHHLQQWQTALSNFRNLVNI